MPISHDIVNLKGNSTFSSCSEWKKFLKHFSGSTKECATEDQTLNHNLVNISFFKIDELGLVGKCVKHSFRIYGLLFAILHAFHKKLYAMPGGIAARSALLGLTFEMLLGVFDTCLCNIACVGITFRLMFVN